MENGFFKGMGLGVLAGTMAGTMVGATMAPKKRSSVKKAADKDMKTVDRAMEDLTERMGFQD